MSVALIFGREGKPGALRSPVESSEPRGAIRSRCVKPLFRDRFAGFLATLLDRQLLGADEVDFP